MDSLLKKLHQVNWSFLLLITGLALIGTAGLYSAAGGAWDPWAMRHVIRYSAVLFLALCIAVLPLTIWLRGAYIIYFGGLVLLLAVEILGQIGGGAQRWIDLGIMRLQPSELMKIGVILALARYFHSRSPDDLRSPFLLLPPAFIIAAPVGLVLLQPDLGTALMLCIAGAGMFFFAGAPLWLFAGGIGLVAASLPVAWQFLHDYQKQRLLTFLDPEADPLGAGYHIMQSKIALGSGGISGKGFLEGSQNYLDFLPEKQTDFIFTLWAEEWGLFGAAGLLLLCALIVIYGYWIAFQARSTFGRLLTLGLTLNFSLYVLINIAMVMGLIPVVGAPLPLVSYGGTAMLAAMSGFGLMICTYVHRDVKIPRYL